MLPQKRKFTILNKLAVAVAGGQGERSFASARRMYAQGHKLKKVPTPGKGKMMPTITN